MNSALLWVLLSLGYQATCAPVLHNEVAFYRSYRASNGSLQDELRSILLTGILSKASNNYTIQKSFTTGTRRICIPITLSISCTNQTTCGPGETAHNCSSGFNSTLVWTDFNSSRLSGKILVYFASMDATMPAMPGFGWSSSCPLDYHYNADSNNYTLSTESVPILDVTVTTLPCMSAHGSDLFDALQYLITLMPPYAEQKENNAATIIDRHTGCARDISHLEADYNRIRDEYGIYAGVVLVLFIFGAVGTFYFHIEESIRATERGKPKLYFHFWSVTLVGFSGFVYIVKTTPLLENTALFTATICLVIVALLLPVAIVSVGVRTSRRNTVIMKLFTSPLAALVPTTLGKFLWQCAATSFGLYFSSVTLCYLIYVTPNVILVYYFYPLRTLIRATYVIGAAFYTVALGAFTLYQFERASETLKLFCCCTSCHRRVRGNGTSRRSFTTRTELDEKHHKRYYVNGFRDTARKYGGVCTVLMMPLNILKFVLSLFVLLMLVQAELILGELLFEKTTITEANIDSLLAILPTIILFIATWLSRGIFFDLTADSRELGLPFSGRGPEIRGAPVDDRVVTTPAHGNRSDEEEEDTGGDGSVVPDISNVWFWTNRERAGQRGGVSKPHRKIADEGVEGTEAVDRRHDGIRPKGTTDMDDSVRETSSAVIIEGARGSAADEIEVVSEGTSVGTIGDAGDGGTVKKSGGCFGRLGCLCCEESPGVKQADSAGEEDPKKRSLLHESKTPSASDGTYGALNRAGNVVKAIGGTASDLGGMASGVGSVAGAVGGGSDVTGKVSGVAGGLSKLFVGFGNILKSFSSACSKPKKNSKRSLEEDPEETEGDKSRESGLGEGLEAAGKVVTGMGGIADGVGGVAGGIGGVEGAVGGNGAVAGKVSGVAGGIGKSLGALGGVGKGLGTVSKGLRFGSQSKRSKESPARRREKNNSNEGDDEGTKEGEGGGGSGSNDETTSLSEEDTPQII